MTIEELIGWVAYQQMLPLSFVLGRPVRMMRGSVTEGLILATSFILPLCFWLYRIAAGRAEYWTDWRGVILMVVGVAAGICWVFRGFEWLERRSRWFPQSI